MVPIMSTVPRLLRALVDDAALFPPGSAPMPAAVAAHPAHRSSWYGEVVGRFLCPASRLDELRGALDAAPPGQEAASGASPLRLGVVADAGPGGLPAALGAVADDERLELSAVEVRLPAGAEREGWVLDLVAVLDATPSRVPGLDARVPGLDARVPGLDGAGGVRAFVEVPRGAGWLDVLPVLRSAGLGAKLRCGGSEPDAVPAPDEVADFVVSCAQQDLPFKATAGLHAALRHTDPATGLAQHGFGNLLAATVAALAGAARPEVAAVLALEEPGPVVTVLAGVDDETARSTRALFTAYGSCSISEPVGDLVALGLVGVP